MQNGTDGAGDGEDSGFFVASDSEELQDPVMSQQQKPVAPVDASLLLSNGVGVGCPEPIRKTISRMPCRVLEVNFKHAALFKDIVSFWLAEVDSYVQWAFTAHKNSCLVSSFQDTLKSCSGMARFQEGIPIASVCTGWGVAEMVMEALNEHMAVVSPDMPKAHVQGCWPLKPCLCVSVCVLHMRTARF